ncbi:MAG: ANTAR domain-containing protein [Ilumatobacteraceae bacterium]
MGAGEADDLRREIERMLAAALATDRTHADELDRRDRLHIAETERRDVLHVGEMQRRQDAFDHDLAAIRDALETRDLIGQAKGIIGAMGCTSDQAFVLLKKQSQAENRKLHEVAADIVAKAQRRR